MERLPRQFCSWSALNAFAGTSARRENPDSGGHLGSFTWGRLVNTVAECTVPEKILLAAHQLEDQGQSPFSAEALIVSSWQKFPRTFGLKGYADQYPDSNKVLSCIMGERGLARRGWLSKMGQKLYALTKEGRNVVQRLQAGGEPTPTTGGSTVKVARDQEKYLLSLFASSASQKFEEGLKDELTFADACRFWGITENMKGDALDERMSHFHSALGELDRVFADADAELSNGRHVDAGEVRVLTNIHRYMEDRFDRHLNLLRSRSARK